MRPIVLLPFGLCATLVATSPALATGHRRASCARTTPCARASSVRIERRQGPPSEDSSRGKGERARASESEKSPIVKAALRVESAPAEAPAPIRHRVQAGETLGAIATRYGVSAAALSSRNGLTKNQALRVDHVLILPKGATRVKKSWHPYAKPASHRGHLDVSTPFSSFSGPMLDSQGRLRSASVKTLNGLLGAGGAHPALPERLIRLLIEASDTFAGRPIRLVSGYRTSSYYEDSRHKSSSAIDFLIVGVPNAVLCDYLREFDDVGVGYYPNSSFVHLDVRNHSAYWVDYAGPGERPRSTPNAPPSAPDSPSSTPRGADRKLLAELDGLLKQAKHAIADVQARRAKPEPELESADE